MPTLDDAPTNQVAKLTGSKLVTASSFTSGTNPTNPTTLNKDDLIHVYDVSEHECKTITIGQLAVAFGLTLA